ncbi:ER membrane protein complex subunit 6 isoform X2 [Mangifera indica]|uniref:ER membrane protein complex subunit 6 isoform X2 n=1 Tax=Mangifera indica TaxID=29780 RepID=UPI001CFB51EA|nr:ER membrane protein complex subunit 6 isoform X2 [Mangifera indica]
MVTIHTHTHIYIYYISNTESLFSVASLVSSSPIVWVENMAGHGDSGASGKKSSEAANELHTFNAENMQSNMKIIYYSRTFLSIIGGAIAGILGFTGLTGFIFYFLIMAMASIGLITKAKFSVHLYFDSWNRILLDGFTGGLMSFVLFWTFAYDIVHIF